jgi:hypothetical protein
MFLGWGISAIVFYCLVAPILYLIRGIINLIIKVMSKYD